MNFSISKFCVCVILSTKTLYAHKTCAGMEKKMNTDFLNHPSLKNMHPAKKQIIFELTKNIKNVSMENMLPLILSTNNKMKEQGLSFTKQENDLLTEILMSKMSPAEKLKAETLLKMIPKK